MESLDFNYFLKHIGDASAISFLIFLCIFLFGTYRILRRKYIKRNGISVEGEIEDLIADNDGEGTMYYPLVSFSTHLDQRKVVYKSNYGSNLRSYKKGQKVKIVYLPEIPGQFLIDESPSKWIEFIFLLSGLIGCLFSIFVFLKDNQLTT